ncbi:hypothetical protein FIV42_16150 [Persicimonas caeni]|uniref:Dickkopf N-terminal cysteine-rich domain-containing protein n=1 Tax=Persicimonas caeni TaxID=2292766 RepID=A0A4Y6PV35_PERCE|nr:hypothetical protein [Persicimonas caeni]QDG52214.1 hypothetical protein FIV42_16150 [Persicimonas caeni]QED33436.1 hypothetical protein FRD00_16145 [Persicimonas caeni]
MQKRTMMGLILLAFSVGVVATGCGDDSSSDSSEAYSEDISHDEFTEAYTRLAIERTFCEYAWQCEVPVYDNYGPARKFESEAECAEKLPTDGMAQEWLSYEFEKNAQLIEAGALAFDSANAAGCLNLIAGLDSSELCDARSVIKGGENPCQEIYSGLTAEGETCIDSIQCAGDDAWCETEGDSCGGTCIVEAGCGDGPSCGDDEVCEYDGETGTESCQPLKAEGEECDFWGCQDGLECVVPEGADVGTCRAPNLGEGEACADTPELCREGLYCIEGTCQSFAFVAQGEACDIAKWGDSDPCEPGLVCHVTAPGETTGQCNPPAAVGEACANGLVCEWNLFCDKTSNDQLGTCAERKADGSACERSVECQSFYCGSEGNCEQLAVCEP